MYFRDRSGTIKMRAKFEKKFGMFDRDQSPGR